MDEAIGTLAQVASTLSSQHDLEEGDQGQTPSDSVPTSVKTESEASFKTDGSSSDDDESYTPSLSIQEDGSDADTEFADNEILDLGIDMFYSRRLVDEGQEDREREASKESEESEESEESDVENSNDEPGEHTTQEIQGEDAGDDVEDEETARRRSEREEARLRRDTMRRMEAFDRILPPAVPGPVDLLVSGERVVRTHKFLGRRWSDMIRHIHDGDPDSPSAAWEQLPGQRVDLHLKPHQVKAVGVLDRALDGTFGGIIFADCMGLGKTLSTLAALAHRDRLGKRTAGFNLIVCPANVVSHWLAEIRKLHGDDYGKLRVVALGSKSASRMAYELLDYGYDIVICSYQYLLQQYNKLMKFSAFCAQCHEHGLHQATYATPKQYRTRPALTLLSELYDHRHRNDNFIDTLVLDESHYAKRWPLGKTNAAILALKYRRLVQLTGTPMPNQWWDLYGILVFQPM